MNEMIAAMREAIEKQEKCVATHLESTIITKQFEDLKFHRAISTFNLRDHPKDIKRAFVWEKFAGGERIEPNYTIVLGIPPVNTAENALQAFIDARMKEEIQRD